MVAAAQASVAFSRSRIQVAAGASVVFVATITPPSLSAADAALYPIYSGWIRLNGAPASGVFSEFYTGEQSSPMRLSPICVLTSTISPVPYFGISGSMFNVPSRWRWRTATGFHADLAPQSHRHFYHHQWPRIRIPVHRHPRRHPAPSDGVYIPGRTSRPHSLCQCVVLRLCRTHFGANKMSNL